MSAPDWLTALPVAHRGLHDPATGLVENTLSAAEAAAALGYAVECDVHLSADDHMIVFHDHALDRLTSGTGALRKHTRDHLASLDIHGTDERIPTLSDLLALIDDRVPLFIEIKGTLGQEKELAHLTADAIAGYPGRIALMSFFPSIVGWLRRRAVDRPVGLLSGRFDDPDSRDLSAWKRFALRNLLAAPFIQPDFIAYDIRGLPSRAPLIARRLGLPLLTWTVRTEEERARAARHADQIIFEDFRAELPAT